MTDIHVTRELLEAVSRGEVPERFLSQAGMQHLASLCPFCREEIRAWEAKKAGSPESAYVLHALPSVLARHTPELEARWRRAEEDLAALLAIPREERRARIERARSRFRGPYLPELLILESRRQIPGDPREAYHLAETARFIIHRSPGTPESFDLVALATAHMANACRAEGDLRQAEEDFQYARHVITHQGVTDPRIVAQIDHLEGSLRKDQRRFAQSEALLKRAAMLYQISGDGGETARVLLTLGEMYFGQGTLGRAIEIVKAALGSLSPEAEPHLYLCGRHNLALYLTDAGQFHEVADLLEVDADLYARFPEPWTQLRLSWLRGMVPIFAAQDVHREATAALRLFQEAARREEVTAGLVQEVAGFLKAARGDSELRFR